MPASDELYALLSWLGDSRFLMPLALACGIAWWRHRPMMAAHWAALAILVVASVAVSKLAYLLLGMAVERLHFYGISGHAAMSALVYPAFGAALSGRAGQRLAGFVLGAGLALAIAVSRVALDLHSVSEVACGLLLGLAASIAFAVRWRARMTLAGTALPVLGISLITAWLLMRGPSVEQLLQRLASRNVGQETGSIRALQEVAQPARRVPYDRRRPAPGMVHGGDAHRMQAAGLQEQRRQIAGGNLGRGVL